MPFQQPPLPYSMDALAPYLSEEQLRFHYGKHHAGYFKNLNALVEGKPEAKLPLRQVVRDGIFVLPPRGASRPAAPSL